MSKEVCPRNCIECTLQPTLETKQMCASFNAIQILSYLEGKVLRLEEMINKPEPEAVLEKVLFNEIPSYIISETAKDMILEPVPVAKEPNESINSLPILDNNEDNNV